MPTPCGKFLIGKCPNTKENCRFSHNKNDAPLCTAWISARCSGRCPKRHYYLDKDVRSDIKENNIYKRDTIDDNIDLEGERVTKEIHTHEVDVVDLDTGETTKKTEVVECQVVDLTNVRSPTKHDTTPANENQENSDRIDGTFIMEESFESSDS